MTMVQVPSEQQGLQQQHQQQQQQYQSQLPTQTRFQYFGQVSHQQQQESQQQQQQHPAPQILSNHSGNNRALVPSTDQSGMRLYEPMRHVWRVLESTVLPQQPYFAAAPENLQALTNNSNNSNNLMVSAPDSSTDRRGELFYKLS